MLVSCKSGQITRKLNILFRQYCSTEFNGSRKRGWSYEAQPSPSSATAVNNTKQLSQIKLQPFSTYYCDSSVSVAGIPVAVGDLVSCYVSPVISTWGILATNMNEMSRLSCNYLLFIHFYTNSIRAIWLLAWPGTEIEYYCSVWCFIMLLS